MTQRHMVYGRHPAEQMVQAQPERIAKIWLQAGPAAQTPRMLALQDAARRAGITTEFVARRALEAMTGAQTHQGVVLEVKPFTYVDLDALITSAPEPALILALDSVQDPHNLGALIRSALALGAHGVVFAKDRACEVTPAVVKASAGATVHLPIARVVNLSRALTTLKDRGLWVMGTSPEGRVPLAQVDLRGPSVVVIGAEGTGMRHGIARACDYIAHIPIVGAAGSLNAGVAGSICLYEAARQRHSQYPISQIFDP